MTQSAYSKALTICAFAFSATVTSGSVLAGTSLTFEELSQPISMENSAEVSNNESIFDSNDTFEKLSQPTTEDSVADYDNLEGINCLRANLPGTVLYDENHQVKTYPVCTEQTKKFWEQ